MNDLLHSVLEAHGGLARWNQFSTVEVQITTAGGLWPLKGLIQDAAPRTMTVSLREPFASITPYGQPNWRTSFQPQRVAIETLEGEVIRERSDPRAAFASHTANTPWDALDRAYFNGYALWTYLTSPFHMAMPGFEVNEMEPLAEGDELWRHLQVRFPEHIASHSDVQDFYFGSDFLLHRHDYAVDVAGGLPAAQYVEGFVEVQGIKLPSRRRAYLRGPDMKPVRELLLVSIDLSDFSFT